MNYEYYCDPGICGRREVALIDTETHVRVISGTFDAAYGILEIAGEAPMSCVLVTNVEDELLKALGRKLTATRTETGVDTDVVNIKDFGAVPDSKPALATQVGGSHYKDMPIQPAEYCHKNGIGKLEGDVIAYVSRWRKKNGIEDLKKARHTIDIILELEGGEDA